jgi:hypothetical protein
MVNEITKTFEVDIANRLLWDGDEWVDMPNDYGSALLQESPTLKFCIDYPLTNPKTVTLVHNDNSGWTERQFVEAVCQAYADIYKEEGDDPGHIDGLMNRKVSYGPYGIWGHDITDLILEGAVLLDNGVWDLEVGS